MLLSIKLFVGDRKTVRERDEVSKISPSGNIKGIESKSEIAERRKNTQR